MNTGIYKASDDGRMEPFGVSEGMWSHSSRGRPAVSVAGGHSQLALKHETKYTSGLTHLE